jgi:hypothetical protein
VTPEERLAKVTRQYNELHYAVRRGANILDHKLTDDEAHEKAMQIVERMHAELEAFHRLASAGQR